MGHCAGLRGNCQAAKIARPGQALAAKPDGLSSAPGAHVVKERSDSQQLPPDLHMATMTHATACMNIRANMDQSMQYIIAGMEKMAVVMC